MSIFTTLEERRRAFEESDVYPVISSEFCAGRDPLFILEEILKGGAKVVQIREKNMADKPHFELLKKARLLTDSYRAVMIVDDRVDLALAVGADGVHLGQDDLPLSAARKIAPELLIGTSTHNLDEVRQAQADGCGYLNIGPIFRTGTKQLPMEPLGVELLQSLIPSVKCPFSVMGGIKLEHLPLLHSLGAKHIAAVTAFTAAENPAEEIRKWRSALR
ncbi:MAG: thiamine phosphate synthase [Lentisphaerae bacterium]|nr:thiamine phosphate synthase [Lentisphaerota bacterium]